MVGAVAALLGMDAAEPPDDARLLELAARGDATAFTTFYRRHVGPVTGLAVRLGTDPDEVADVVSETFVIALDRAPRYRAESPSARPWLLGIAWRVAHRGFRQRARQARLRRRLGSALPRFSGDEAEAVAAALDAARLAPEVAASIASLPRSEREVVELVTLAGLGISANAARLRLSRARQRLRSDLAEATPPATRQESEAPT
jgi:DNA-directed RNA polymerase specialized sigma24 family protein